MIKSKQKSLLVVLLLAAWVFAEPQEPIAPDISIKEWVYGEKYPLDYMAGNPYVVDFWATWCGPCLQTMPIMEEIHEKYAAKGLRVLGLSVDDETGVVEDFIEDNNIKYSIAMDKNTSGDYGIRGLPTVVVIDAAGVVQWGGHPADEVFEKVVKAVVEKSPKPILKGLDLSDFEGIEEQLKEGKSFKKAIKELEKIAKSQSPQSKKAQEIITEINARLDALEEYADKLVSEERYEPALKIYTAMARNYPGSDISEKVSEKIKDIKKAK